MKIIRLIQAKWIVWLIVFACSGAFFQALAESVHAAADASPSVQSPNEQKIANDASAMDEARSLRTEGNYQGALNIYKQIESPNAHVLNEMGISYEHLNDLDKARASYERSIKLDPKLSNAYNNLATVYYIEHNDKKAEKLYKKAIKANPENASAFKNLGTSYFVRRRYRQGREAYEDALRIDVDVFTRGPNFVVNSLDRQQLAAMNFFLAELCAQSGQPNAALAYLAQALKEGFNNQPLLQNDKALASVRQMPAFGALLKKE